MHDLYEKEFTELDKSMAFSPIQNLIDGKMLRNNKSKNSRVLAPRVQLKHKLKYIKTNST